MAPAAPRAPPGRQAPHAHRRTHLARDDLLFTRPAGLARYRIPDVLPDPATLDWTEPNDKGRRYRHGTSTAYALAKCRCRHCRDAVAAYRSARRTAGKDHPRTRQTVDTDEHIGRSWFRKAIWLPALETANLGFHVTPHGLRHAHASWLLAGGADLQIVKERLGHASIITTEKYLHTLPHADEAALEALAAVRGAWQSTGSAADDRDEELQGLRRALAQFRAVFDSLPSVQRPDRFEANR